MKWFRKRGIPCLLIFSLLFSLLTVPAWSWTDLETSTYNAYFKYNSWSAPAGYALNNDTGVIGPLKFSNVPEENLNSIFAFMREFERDFKNGNTHHHVTAGDKYISISSFPTWISYSCFKVDSKYVNGKPDAFGLIFTRNVSTTYLRFDARTGECVVDDVVPLDYGPNSIFSLTSVASTFLLSIGYTRQNMWSKAGKKHWKPFWYDESVSVDIDYSRAAPLTHTLSIDYLYEDGTEAAPSHVQLLEEGSNYEVPSPEVPGYTPDKTSIAGEMGIEDAVFTVTYIKDPVPVDSRMLTIYYLLADGSQAAEPYFAVVGVGEDYSVLSPVVSGYQTDCYTVSGTMGIEDAVFTVIYTPLAVISKHSLTIRYQTADGRELAPVYSALLAEGEPYSVASPAVTGYQPDRDAVSGAMGAEDVLVTVIYASSGTDPTVPGVDVSYQFEDGSAAAPACRKELSYGQFYWIASPSVPGYTPDRRILFGTVPRSGVSYTVTYRANDSGNGSGIPWLPSAGGGIQWEPPAVSGLPYLPSDAGGIPWKP